MRQTCLANWACVALQLRAGGQRIARCPLSLRPPLGDGLGVGAAAGVAALTALGLRQQGIDLFTNGIAFHAKPHRSKSKQGAEDAAETEEREQRDQQGLFSECGYHQMRPAKPMKASEARPAVIMPMAAP